MNGKFRWDFAEKRKITSLAAPRGVFLAGKFSENPTRNIYLYKLSMNLKIVSVFRQNDCAKIRLWDSERMMENLTVFTDVTLYISWTVNIFWVIHWPNFMPLYVQFFGSCIIVNNLKSKLNYIGKFDVKQEFRNRILYFIWKSLVPKY